MQWYLDVWSRGPDFQERSGRKEYWMVFLVNTILFFVLSFLGGLGEFLSPIYSLMALIPGLAVAVRRLHDIGKRWYCIS